MPYKVFEDPQQRWLVIAHHFHGQTSFRDIHVSHEMVLVYDITSLELLAHTSVTFKVRDLAFHPSQPIICIGTGEYDGGAEYSGELLMWHLEEKPKALIEDSRFVKSLSFVEKNKLRFVLYPQFDEYMCLDEFLESAFEIDIFQKTTQIKNLEILATSMPSKLSYDWQGEYKEADRALKEIAKRHQVTYLNRNMIWGLVFVDDATLAIARNLGIVEIIDLSKTNLPTKQIVLPHNENQQGNCQQLFFNSANNTLLVNVTYTFLNNKIYSIDLRDDTIDLILEGSYSLSQNKNNYFLARNTDGGMDVILDPDYAIIHQEDLGHYDLFNHYIRIDGQEIFYFVQANPKDQHQNKSILSLDSVSFESKHLWKIEEQPEHFNDISGILLDQHLIINARLYNGRGNNNTILYCINLEKGEKIWTNDITNSQATCFGRRDEDCFVVAYNDGQVQIVDKLTGELREKIKRDQNHYNIPISLAIHDKVLAIGLVNGEVERYELL